MSRRKERRNKLFGRKRNGAKKMQKHINDECKYGISKTQTLCTVPYPGVD